MSTQYSQGGETSPGTSQSGTGAGAGGGRGPLSGTGSSSSSSSSSASDLNFGSARSDYGDEAYGGTLNEEGSGGAGYDDFSEGREAGASDRAASPGRSLRKSMRGGGGSRAGAGYGLGDAGTGLALLAGIVTGAALMYFLDPQQGGGRRALLRDKFTGLSNDATDILGKATRDLSNRAQGLIAEATKAVGLGQGESGAEGSRQGQSGSSSSQQAGA
jgi:hypothetical protein